MPIFSIQRAVSILLQGKRQRTRTTYNSSGTQLHTIKFVLLPFWPKENSRRCVTSPLWISSGAPFYCRNLQVRRKLYTPEEMCSVYSWPLCINSHAQEEVADHVWNHFCTVVYPPQPLNHLPANSFYSCNVCRLSRCRMWQKQLILCWNVVKMNWRLFWRSWPSVYYTWSAVI